MAGLTPAHLLIILVIALIVIGPGKLPEVGSAIGKSFREFQKATSGSQDAAAAAESAPAAHPVAVQPAAQPIYPAPYAPTHPYLPSQAVYPAGPVYMTQPDFANVQPQAQAPAPAPQPFYTAVPQPAQTTAAPTPGGQPADPRVG